MTSTLPATNSKSPWKSMVGRCKFSFGMTYFQLLLLGVTPSFSTRNLGTEPTSAPEMDVTEVHWNDPSIHWRCWQWSEFGPLWYWDRCAWQSVTTWVGKKWRERTPIFICFSETEDLVSTPKNLVFFPRFLNKTLHLNWGEDRIQLVLGFKDFGTNLGVKEPLRKLWFQQFFF